MWWEPQILSIHKDNILRIVMAMPGQGWGGGALSLRDLFIIEMPLPVHAFNKTDTRQAAERSADG
ncbi:hypothetical protein BOTNAR_0146g00100 [Botryotinia narcissicola]|uniref:Uncharacterized protein n=1 Tax=Botryotinia narcissicola TaxID=278944 RepID=A0A4Z1IUU5_9HELO|nr:hypothetical protein BOTNAR_0146g00100 [Botryotinia narcissicola]